MARRKSHGHKRLMGRTGAAIFAIIGAVLALAAHINHNDLGIGIGFALVAAAIII